MRTSEIISKIEKDRLQMLLSKSDLKASVNLLINYLMIAACFALVALYPTFWAWLIAAIVLAGRQLGLAILMHDCAHHGFFKSRWANNAIGQWLCGAPVLADIDRYRTYHLEHHRTAGSPNDPDRTNYENYPVSRSSMKRKLLRDLIGITGFKIFLTVLKMNAGTVAYQLAYDHKKKEKGISLQRQILNMIKGLAPSTAFHGVLFTLFYILGRPEIYFLWWVAWFTFYMVFSRLRNAAEHGATLDINDLNPLKNTRTTLAAWWERLLVAPNYVNYHLEHHLLPAIPSYHLQAFHNVLKEKKLLNETKIANGYREVLKDLIK